MRRTLVIVAALIAVLAAAGAGGFTLWKGSENARLQRLLANHIAAGMMSGSLDPGDFHATPGVAPTDDYATILKGMGSLKPTVSVVKVVPHIDENYADAVLHLSWTPYAQEPWAYDVTVPLQITADGWKASWSASVVAPDLKDTERLLLSRLAPTRGSILGAQGAQLAYNQPAIRVGVDKANLAAADLVPTAQAIAAALTAAGVSVNADNYVKKVQSAGAKAFVEAALLRTKDPKQAAALKAVRAVPGVRTLQTTAALGITSSFLRPILGQVGDATPEIIAASQGAVVAGDQVGTGGLQKTQDAVLRGKPGYVVQAILREGVQARDLKRVTATDGTNVTLTVDAQLQASAEAILAPVTPASAIVAIRPSDGALLAVASGPGSAGVASTATQALYEPGSTFKTVSGLAMLRKGLTPTSTLECTPSIVVDGYTFNNDEGYPASALGSIPWTTAFAHSCNTAVISQAETVSQGDLAQAAAALGLTVDPGLGVPVTVSRVPSSAGSKTEHAASMIGQGKVLTTPLGMATVVASIAKGETVRPVLITGGAAPTSGAGSGSASPSTSSSGTPSAPATSGGAPAASGITGAEGEALRTLMRGVVTEGTASTVLAGTPGGPVMAKTGTATYIKDGQQRWHTWLVAIQGDLAVAVMVADGDYGAATCGPLLKAFLTAANGG